GCEIAIAFRLPSPLIKAMVAGSSIEMQSHKTFPLGVQTTSARWPIANCGCVPMPITPGSYWRYELKCPAIRAASVVQGCPRVEITAALLRKLRIAAARHCSACIGCAGSANERFHISVPGTYGLCTLIIDRPRPASLAGILPVKRNGDAAVSF